VQHRYGDVLRIGEDPIALDGRCGKELVRDLLGQRAFGPDLPAVALANDGEGRQRGRADDDRGTIVHHRSFTLRRHADPCLAADHAHDGNRDRVVIVAGSERRREAGTRRPVGGRRPPEGQDPIDILPLLRREVLLNDRAKGVFVADGLLRTRPAKPDQRQHHDHC
jgi:hypothetical protein